MNLDDKYILAFVRQNMFPDNQMVHTFHLGFLIGQAVDGYCQKRYKLTGHPNVLVYGVKDKSELEATAALLSKQGIELIQWNDPDTNPEHDDYETPGMVTQPITKTQRNRLPRFKQWSANNNTHPFPKDTVVAQSPQEHSLYKGEVGTRQVSNGANVDTE